MSEPSEEHSSSGGAGVGEVSDVHCVICDDICDDVDSILVGKKGLDALLKFSQSRGDEGLHSYLLDKANTTPIGKVLVHAACRKKYTDIRRKITDIHDEAGPSQKRLRSSILDDMFNWTEHCVLCGDPARFDTKHPDRDRVITVETLPIRDTLLKQCDIRADSWATTVQTRVENCIDMVAAEARYHLRCYSTFMYTSTPKYTGRPNDGDMNDWFDALCNWIENDCDVELYTLEELHASMDTLAGDNEVYSQKRLKQKLEDHYGDHIVFSEICGRKNVVCFRNMAHLIINEWYSESRKTPKDDAERIVRAAAKIIREEARESTYTLDEYPSKEDIKNLDRGRQYLGSCLRTFVEKLIPTNKLKQVSIGKAILQAVKPRSVMAPIMFGLGTEVDHIVESRWLVDELYQLGFSISYDEVRLFKQSVMQEESLETLSPPPDQVFTQWSADNVDHNIRTLTGEGTFHGMGLIAMFTENQLHADDEHIKRRAKVNVDELVAGKGIPIIQYNGRSIRALSETVLKPVLTLQVPYTGLPSVFYSNVLWKSAGLLNRSSTHTPNWSGFMQHVFGGNNGQTVTKSEVLILPIIDLNPNDDTCIYSTLLYIEKQAHRLNMPTACVTFDQPLWLKAMEIVTSKRLDNIVVRLGGFHLLMSACGSVFRMMKGSGIEEALEEVYGSNAIVHMMTGKSIARALRGLYLIDMALTTKLLATVLPCQSSDNETGISQSISGSTRSMVIELQNHSDIEDEISVLTEEQVNGVQKLIDDVLDQSIPPDAIADSPDLTALNEAVESTKTVLSTKSRTAKLWIHCLQYIEVIKEFISCERLGIWEGHLIAVGKFLNLFAATGHMHYAKSARLYLQTMRELPQSHTWLYNRFSEEGYHTVRRSDRLWAGLWTDLVIEQVMMRSLKSRGGLTRGRGMTESVRQQWVYSLHACAAVHDAMSSLTGKQHTTSEQHVDFGKARREHDWKDMVKIMEWFQVHDPFDCEVTQLRSLASGLTASEGDGINCDDTENVGGQLQRSMDNQYVTNASIKRSKTIHTLDELKPGIKLDKKVVQIDLSVLFMRCTALAQREDDDITPYFAHEMTSTPTSLFKDNFMRKIDKSELARTIKVDLTNQIDNAATPQSPHGMHVVDGGWLLHCVRWNRNTTYAQIIEQYSSFIRNRFGMCCIVFDGYNKPSTKDHEHQRRHAGKVSCDILVTDSVKAYKDQEAFLSNKRNKTQLIERIAKHLQAQGHVVKVSSGDADTLIVSTALNYARNGQYVVVVAEDTDIFIMLLHHWTIDMADIVIRKESSRSKTGQVYSLMEAYDSIPDDIRKHILFIHAWSGCDTTSATYGHGKTFLLKHMKKSTEVKMLSDTISMRGNTATEIGDAGIRLFSVLYGAKKDDTLITLRYAKYMAMMAKSNRVEPQRLPPTERAAHYHSLRVHVQVVRWVELNNDALMDDEWGWKEESGSLHPIMTDLDAAPSKVLNYIRCKCSPTGRNPCGTNLCSCQKNGLKCVTACPGCRGESCRNTEPVIDDDACDDHALGML